jgi:hypothetical protein
MNSTAVQFYEDQHAATDNRRTTFKFGVGAGLALLMSTAVPVLEETKTPTARAAIIVDQNTTEQRRRKYRAPIEHGMARLKKFAKYKADWDSRGASAPMTRAVDAALRYLTFLQSWHPNPLATISRDGEAVLEFDDNDAFSSLRFRDDNGLIVEVYRRPKDSPRSTFREGSTRDVDINKLIRDELKLPTLPHDFV